MLKKLKLNNKGFTIIEVLIVLAIAALIMLIVFLAIPQLSRNSRNTQRNSDGARTLSLVNECLNNHNFNPFACATAAAVGWSAGEMALLNTSPTFGAGQGTVSQAFIHFNTDCDATGSTTGATVNRSVAVTYQLEAGGGGTSNKCIKS